MNDVTKRDVFSQVGDHLDLLAGSSISLHWISPLVTGR